MEKMNFWFGKTTSIDLHHVDIKMITPEKIKKYTRDACKLLKMKRHGDTLIGRFGKGKLRGYSMMQFIETSSITAHFDDKGHRAFIDIFSCQKYDSKKIANFTEKYFKATKMKMHVYERL